MDIYVAAREGGSLHTAVAKTFIGNDYYIVAVGYSGGGTYSHFCCKIWSDNESPYKGHYAYVQDPDEWEGEISDFEFVEGVKNVEPEDKIVIDGIVRELYLKFIDVSDDGDEYSIRPGVVDQMVDGIYMTENWTSDGVDFVSNNGWGLSYRFEEG
jgi:hypothetical protein